MNVIEKQGNVLVPSTYLNPEDLNRELNIIHGCNAQGIMGAGLALQVRNKSKKYIKFINKLVILKLMINNLYLVLLLLNVLVLILLLSLTLAIIQL